MTLTCTTIIHGRTVKVVLDSTRLIAVEAAD